MKKPILLISLFLLLIIIGIVGISSSSSNDTAADGPVALTADAAETSDAVATSNAAEFSGLDMVKIPDSTPSQIKAYEGFRLSFNKENHTPNWVAWELLGSETDGAEKRSNKFWADSEITGCPETSDYTRSGYDRGHMCPSADQKWSAKAMEDCFVMTNMVPQDHALNAGAWGTLEDKERQWAKRDSAIIIIAGPLYDASDKNRIGSIGVRVPSACYKVLAAPYANPPRGIAFLYPNMTAPGNMENYAMTIRELESLTGFDFLYNLPDSIEELVETTASFKEWNKR